MPSMLIVCNLDAGCTTRDGTVQPKNTAFDRVATSDFPPPTGCVLITDDGRPLYVQNSGQNAVLPAATRVSLGNSYTVPANVNLIRFTQSASVSASTISLPTAMFDGQSIQFVNYAGAVTALTFSPAVNGWTNGSTFAAYSGARVRWDATAAAWYREQ